MIQNMSQYNPAGGGGGPGMPGSAPASGADGPGDSKADGDSSDSVVGAEGGAASNRMESTGCISTLLAACPSCPAPPCGTSKNPTPVTTTGTSVSFILLVAVRVESNFRRAARI